MRFHDISVTVTSMLPTWPGDPKVELDRVEKIEEGANANVSRVAMGVHTGTHVDAPYHFLEEEKAFHQQDKSIHRQQPFGHYLQDPLR